MALKIFFVHLELYRLYGTCITSAREVLTFCLFFFKAGFNMGCFQNFLGSFFISRFLLGIAEGIAKEGGSPRCHSSHLELSAAAVGRSLRPHSWWQEQTARGLSALPSPLASVIPLHEHLPPANSAAPALSLAGSLTVSGLQCIGDSSQANHCVRSTYFLAPSDIRVLSFAPVLINLWLRWLYFNISVHISFCLERKMWETRFWLGGDLIPRLTYVLTTKLLCPSFFPWTNTYL